MSSNFDFWYVVLPVFILVMAMLGTRKYIPDYYSDRIRSRAKRKIYKKGFKIIAIVMAVIITLMVIFESGDYIVQFLLDYIVRGDGSAWADLLLGVPVSPLIGFFVYVMLVIAEKIGEWAKYGYLVEKRNKNRKKALEKNEPYVLEHLNIVP